MRPSLCDSKAYGRTEENWLKINSANYSHLMWGMHLTVYRPRVHGGATAPLVPACRGPEVPTTVWRNSLVTTPLIKHSCHLNVASNQSSKKVHREMKTIRLHHGLTAAFFPFFVRTEGTPRSCTQHSQGRPWSAAPRFRVVLWPAQRAGPGRPWV